MRVPKSNILMDIGAIMIQSNIRVVSWMGSQLFNAGFAVSRIGEKKHD